MKQQSMSITIDIEDWYHIPSVCGSPFSVYRDVNEFFEKWNDRYDFLSEPTKSVLNLLDAYRINATFFVVADVIEHYPGLVEHIADRGHEIGCHGLHHACKIDPRSKKPLLSIEEFKKRTVKAKRILERIYGEAIYGYRAPNAFTSGWMIDSLEEIGFKYDSSVCVNSIYNKTDSMLKGVSSYPYYPLVNKLDVGSDRDFIEFPWAYYDIGIKIPTSGGPTLRFLSKYIILKGLKQSLKRGHTIFYFHPLDVSYERFPNVGKGRPFYWLIKGKAIERKIRYILNNTQYARKVSLKDYLGGIL